MLTRGDGRPSSVGAVAELSNILLIGGGRLARHLGRYFDKGNMAVVGKNYAVLELGWLHTSGFLTWLLWAFVHILSLPQLQNRLRVQRQWLWSYFTGQRSSRIIPEPPRGGTLEPGS